MRTSLVARRRRSVLPVVAATALAMLTTGCNAGHKANVAASSPETSAATTTSAPPSSAAPSPTAAATTAKPTPTHTTLKPTATPTPTQHHTATATPTPTHTSTSGGGTAAPAGSYAFPVQGCSVNYGAYHHDYPAADIFAARGCAFVAVVSGTVDEVSFHDTWSSTTNTGGSRGGLSVSIVGNDGVRYYGSHLSAIAAGIAPGVHVHVGQLLGRVGNTGDARGIQTHVHFGMSWPTRPGVWWVRRGMVSPYKYLVSWHSGGSRSPAAAVAAVHAQDGDVPACHVDC